MPHVIFLNNKFCLLSPFSLALMYPSVIVSNINYIEPMWQTQPFPHYHPAIIGTFFKCSACIISLTVVNSTQLEEPQLLAQTRFSLNTLSQRVFSCLGRQNETAKEKGRRGRFSPNIFIVVAQRVAIISSNVLM